MTLLSFEVNPISKVPANCFTGRVEATWNMVRVAAVLMTYLQSSITPILALVLFCLLQLLVLVFHVKTLPFHSHAFNLLRSGIYATVLWAGIASALVSSLTRHSVGVQWALLALAPVCFGLGLAATHRQKSAILSSIRRFRAELCPPAPAGSALRPSRRAASSVAPSCVGGANGGGGAAAAGAGGRPADPFDDFYDVESRASRAFESASSAHVTIRVLLHERDLRGPAAHYPPHSDSSSPPTHPTPPHHAHCRSEIAPLHPARVKRAEWPGHSKMNGLARNYSPHALLYC